MIQHGQASQRWAHLDTKRSEVLARAERAAEVTIPSLMPREGHTENTKLKTPYQGLGAKGVNHLASKITLALFPPNTAWFKIGFDEITQARLEGQELDLAKINADLSKIEQTVVSELEQTRLRQVIALSVKHLLVTGNILIDVMPDGGFRYLNLRHFVVNRDPSSAIIELIIKESVSPQTLSEETLQACFEPAELQEFSTNPEKNVDVYTAMYRDGNKYKVFQEINKKLVPGSEGSYPLYAPRFIILRWTSISDEDYGRGFVDEYYGDVKALDDLSRDLLKASALAAKVVFAVDPNSYITPRKLEDARSGDVIKGSAEDVSTIGVDKLNDFQIVLERLRDITQTLEEAFLMNSSIQRNAERVTAEEIRFMAQELEDSLGGVYSTLAQDLQVPLLRRILKQLASKKLIPDVPADGVKLSITTGLEALGRGHEVNKLMAFIQAARETVGEQELVMRINTESVLKALSAGFGLDTEDLIRTEEEVNQMRQAQLAQTTMASAAPGMMQEAMRQGGQPNG